MGLKKFLRCVRHSRPQACGHRRGDLGGAFFRPSFRGGIRVAVNRGFGRRIEQFARAARILWLDSAVDELAAILFTSGSTGPAKGVCYEHGMFAAQVAAIGTQYDIRPVRSTCRCYRFLRCLIPRLGMCTCGSGDESESAGERGSG